MRVISFQIPKILSSMTRVCLNLLTTNAEPSKKAKVKAKKKK